jgi:hypothetical protein
VARAWFDGRRNHGQRVFFKGASDVTRGVRPAQRVASSIRRCAGNRANEQAESNRAERLGCPVHSCVDRRRLMGPDRLLQTHHGRWP